MLDDIKMGNIHSGYEYEPDEDLPLRDFSSLLVKCLADNSYEDKLPNALALAKLIDDILHDEPAF